MIQKPEYVKELLRKQQEGVLEAMEAGHLRAARMLYSEEEWLDMITDVLWETGAKRPDDPLAGWKPDFKEIVKKSARAGRRRKYWKYSMWTGLAGAAILLISLLIPVYDRISLSYLPRVGICEAGYTIADIPLEGFSCKLRWSDSVEITVDGNKRGVIAQMRNLEIRRDEPGTLLFRPMAGKSTDMEKGIYVEVRTTPSQQCLVILPDGSRFRLNAASSLRYYPHVNADTSVRYVFLEGDVYVQVKEASDTERLVIETSNGQLQSSAAKFAVSAANGRTRATLIDGKLTVISRQEKQSRQIKGEGNLASIESRRDILGKTTDSISTGHMPLAEAIRWMKVTRAYKNASLREFVTEMSRWYGFKIKDPHCIPEGPRISVAVCYQAPEAQVLAEIRNAGVLVTEYKEKNMISFCEPSPIKDFRGKLAQILPQLVIFMKGTL